MYSMEFFNRCNITHPDVASDAPFQIQGSKLIPTNFSGVTAYQISSTEKPLTRHFRNSMWATSRSIKGASRVVGSVSAEENSKSRDSNSGLYFGQATDKEELAAIRESAIRSSLMKKLSDANLYVRHLQRQLHEKEDTLLKCKSELTAIETDIQALVSLAQEVANKGASLGMRKIDGKYIQSHVAVKLEELHASLRQQVENIEAACFRNVPFVWYGMAEDVQIMGSFDGWTRGLQLSPETTGSFTKFSATVKLRPGRYQVKLLIDGKWQMLPDLPLVGEGPLANSLLVVE